MINYMDERYVWNTTKLLKIYDIALFIKPIYGQILQALMVILGLMIQIEEDEVMVRMDFNIV